ncbi:6-phosphofructo-2-kinase/fructose-2,6-bisphosphatase-like isoform X2 [Hyalella azteca]|uniref:6-phosphofructo-2-kinase/fructose-2, 6-bisphosphatase-like isoform X2 n=1 Tax=Hyalella azteca TaxID=294128 RepID=A0A8B7NRK4_HYAAZ|nr:6-phosphofructo-2-kinase/fructose-2,6-bisphosphatase-like isoform X2 [Hyalella azteca]
MAPTPTMEMDDSFQQDWQDLIATHPVCRMTRDTSDPPIDAVNIPHVVAMVGLPARGKTFIAMKLARYLNWAGMPTKVFNVGDYRRKAMELFPGHDFFLTGNREGTAIRNRVALDALQDVVEFLASGGQVGVYDAANISQERRKLIHHIIVERLGYKLFFIESICNEPKIIEANIMESKVTNPDYSDMATEDAVSDFLKRIDHYCSRYETIDEENEKTFSFMKIFDAGRRVVVHKQEGHIQSRVAYYLMNIHITPRSIYLTRHGESVFNQMGRIGGDSDLSPNGLEYSKALAKFIKSQNIPNLRVWTSYMKRTIQTASNIDAPQERWKALNEIDAGICEGLTYEEIQEQLPGEFAARDNNKYQYRYPRGESYEDVVYRLESVMMELERQENVLVVGHQAVLRCVLAYFLDKTGEELPYLKVPLHSIIKLTPQAYGCKVELFKIPIDCVDTHRCKPLNCSMNRSADDALITVPPHY